MKRFIEVSLLSLSLLAGTGFLGSCSSKTEGTASDGCNVTATEFAKADIGDAVILDVRTPGEYNSGHLNNAQLFNISDSSFKEKIAGLDKNKKYYVYCKAGIRSSNAVKYMTSSGFTNVCNIDGGISALSSAGVTLIK